MACACFYYDNKKYEFDPNKFNSISDYFKGKKIIRNDLINLVSDFDSTPRISEESIETFIHFFENQDIQITDSNALSLNYLAERFNIPVLLKKTNEYIVNNEKKIIDVALSEKKTNHHIEVLISKYLIDFIKDDRLLSFSIAQIYRILQMFSNNNQLNENTEKEMIDFFFNLMKVNGEEAIILFSIFDFSQNDYYHQKIIEEIKNFDNPLVHKAFFESMKYILIKSKEKDKLDIEQIKKDLKEKYEKQIDELKQDFEAQKLEFQAKLDLEKQEKEKIKEECANLIEEQRKSISFELESLKKTIYNINSSQYFNGQNNIDSFNNMMGDTQVFIISGIVDSKQNEDFEFLKELLLFFSKEQRRSKYKYDQNNYIKIHIKDPKEYMLNNININDIEYIVVNYQTVKMLYENKTLNSEEFFECSCIY